MRLIDVVPPPALVPAAPDVAMIAEVKRRNGFVPGALAYVAPVPWVFELYARVIKAPIFAAPPEIVELASFVTAYENSCRHCYGAARAALRMVGHTDAWIDELERGAQLAELDPKQRSVLELARKLARSTPRPARTEREALARAYGGDAATELAYKIAGGCFTNRVATFLSLPPDHTPEGIASKWFLPLIRPMLRRMLRRTSEPLAPIPLDGPFANVLEAMGAISVTFVMRKAIDGALASSILPRRAKLLIFAIVARSMACATCEPEATRLLATDGLESADVDRILRNLTGPELTPLETTLVSFARGSVRYEFLEAQDRVRRELVPTLAGPQLIEAVGACALANMVVRLAMLAA
jgi:AhpD family alkylhydroperoxidase